MTVLNSWLSVHATDRATTTSAAPPPRARSARRATDLRFPAPAVAHWGRIEPIRPLDALRVTVLGVHPEHHRDLRRVARHACAESSTNAVAAATTCLARSSRIAVSGVS